MLLIPKAVQRIKAAGYAEGLAEGYAQGLAEARAARHAAWRARFAEAYRRFGIDVDGVRGLPDTQEVRDFLDGKAPEQP